MTYVKERPATTGKGMEDIVQSPSPDGQNPAAVATHPLSDTLQPETEQSNKPPSDPPRDTTAPPSSLDVEELTLRCPIHQSLTFYLSDSETAEAPPKPLSLMVLEVALIPDGPVLLDCRLTLQVPFAVYQDMLCHHWFNLIPAILHPGHDEDFNSEQDVVIDIGVKPDCLDQLTALLLSELSIDAPTPSSGSPVSDKGISGNLNPEAIVHRLIALNEEESDETFSLFQVEQWLCCSVQQHRDEDDVGYTTIWSHLLVHPLINDESELADNDAVVDAFATLFKDAALTFQSEFEKQLPQLQSNWLGFLDDLKEIVDEVVDDLNTDDGETDTPDTTIDPAIHVKEAEAEALSLMDQVVKPFFDREDWSFVQLDETMLQLAFQGENGRWTCLAESSDDTQQFIFYSLYPFQIESTDQPAMAEFLTRANNGMIIGNFELNFGTGELRFKTSVDVDGIQFNLSSCHSVYQQIWQQLAYINVITMDRYFPGITALVNQTLTPEEAIALVEQ